MIKYAEELTEKDLRYYLDDKLGFRKLGVIAKLSVESKIDMLRKHAGRINDNFIVTYRTVPGPNIHRALVVDINTYRDVYEFRRLDKGWENALIRASFWIMEQEGFDFPD